MVGLNKSLAFIGGVSAHVGGEQPDADAETRSITRLEGSRWRGGRLWSWIRDPRAWTAVDREAGGAGATAAPTGLGVRAPRRGGVRSAISGSTHTSPETWTTTLLQMLAPTVADTHEVSKPHVRDARWSAERIGPTIIAAPQCGHVHVARVGAAVAAGVDVGVGDAGDAGAESTVRARARRAARHVLARKPDWRIRTKPRGKMCWTKRRRNSMALRVIVRRWSSRA